MTEGGSATFTVTASPAPASNLAVSVTVSQSGDYGAATGQRAVTVPTRGSVTFTVGTTDDSADETDGSVTATVDAGSGYTVSASQGAVTVAVSDDDDAPVVAPVVSISGGGVTEGGSATFPVTASPAPASNLAVSVAVSQSGDHGAATGRRTVTIPTTGSVTFTVATTNNQADEADGSVTATLVDGTAYDLGSPQTATVTVADDDDPPVVVPVVSIAAGGGVTEGGAASFTLSASPAPASAIDVTVTVTATGDYGVTTGQRTVTIPTSGSVTFTVGTADDQADEPDGSITVTLNTGSGYSGSGSATVAVSDNDDPPPPVENTDPPVGGALPDIASLTACEGRPELLISSPTASRSDASVDFTVMLSCLPGRTPTILLVPVRDGELGQHLFVELTGEEPSTTVTVTIGSERELGLALAWSSGLASREAQGDIVFTD